MRKALIDERNRVIYTLAGAVVVGLIVGQVPWSLAIAGAGLAVYSTWQGLQLLAWQNGGKKPPPSESGLWAEVYSHIRRDRRASDERRRKLMEVLRWYSASADALPDAALILDEHNTIVGSNQAAFRTLGISHKRDRGQRVDNLLRDPLLLSLLNGELAEPKIEMESPVNLGETLRIRLTNYGASSRLLLAQDISEQVRNHNMRQAFVANVSHELHTPLTVVNGHLELLLDDTDLTDDQHDQLLQISSQSHRMQDLVHDLLSLARLESAPTLAEGEQVAVASLVEAESCAIEDSGRFPEHQLTIDLDSKLRVMGRRSEIVSITHNLLVNAQNHTPPGTKVHIEWKLNPEGRPVLTVTDNGPGIDPEHLPRLTERFYRADPGRCSDKGGTGLGLAIVKHCLQHHGGELRINSTPGKGSEFIALFSAERAVYGNTEA